MFEANEIKQANRQRQAPQANVAPKTPKDTKKAAGKDKSLLEAEKVFR